MVTKTTLQGGMLQNFGKSKINNLDIRVWVFSLKQKVLRLQIPVGNSLLMAIVKGLQDLLENLSCNFLRKELFLDDAVKQFTSRAQLSDEVHIFCIFKVLIKLEYIGMVQ
jgi:hypothetical protein